MILKKLMPMLIRILTLLLSVALTHGPAVADENPEIVQDIQIRGNAKVESEAIVTLLKTRKADPLRAADIQEDIRTLYELGYFSDIRVYKSPVDGGVALTFQVVEKPAIVSIEIKGNEELTEENIREKLSTKLFTIVNEATITNDVRIISKQYAEKGYFLANVTYTLEKQGANEVALTFHINEGGKIQVGSVEILGNQFYSDLDIIAGTPGLASRPYTRSSALGSSSLYQEDFVKRDLEYISYIYRDQGFAEVKVAKPFQFIDPDRNFVRLTFQVEEGLQYDVGSIDVSGDLLFEKQELFDEMKLKSNELFRYSRFTRDIEMLVDKYGDLGYAYADVNPKTTFDREKRLVHINYEITKGEKVYFGRMTIIGNTKTRDNVIRREFEVADSELYSGTGLTRSKTNVNRLGYFEEVQIIKERDEKQQNLLNLNIKVKEKATGQLQAAIGFTPSSSGSQGSQWFGQGRYDEKNQSGKGWNTNLTGKWNGEENYSLDLGFSDPRVNDSIWSAGFSAFYSNDKRKQFDEVVVVDKKVGGSVFVGRKIIELIRGRLTYRISKTTSDAGDTYVLPQFTSQGVSSSVIFSLIRNNLDNYIDPTSGTEVTLSQNFTGGSILRGDHQYMESSAVAAGYLPIDFSETYRTYFKLNGVLSYIYPMGDKAVPFSERYRLGGPNDMRGYDYGDIGPRFSLLRSPGSRLTTINKGGDKKLYGQLEYFMPLIPEAGIKSLVFADAGRVYDDDEPIELKGLYKDVGFGFRWITPIAPFRFEWAYPILEGGKLGDMEIIFYIGY
jgi:outer membrane protein insertion porin family